MKRIRERTGRWPPSLRGACASGLSLHFSGWGGDSNRGLEKTGLFYRKEKLSLCAAELL